MSIEHNGNKYIHLESDADYKYYLIESANGERESQIVIYSGDLGKTVTATYCHNLLGDIDVTFKFEHEFLERLWHEGQVAGDPPLTTDIAIYSEDLGETFTATYCHNFLGDIDVTDKFEHEFLERLWHEGQVAGEPPLTTDIEDDPLNFLGDEVSCTTYYPNGNTDCKTWYKGDALQCGMAH